MSMLNVRLPDSLAKKLEELARRDGISADEFVSSAVAEKIAALLTEEFIAARAGKGSRQAFDAALAKVPDAPLVAEDQF